MVGGRGLATLMAVRNLAFLPTLPTNYMGWFGPARGTIFRVSISYVEGKEKEPYTSVSPPSVTAVTVAGTGNGSGTS